MQVSAPPTGRFSCNLHFGGEQKVDTAGALVFGILGGGNPTIPIKKDIIARNVYSLALAQGRVGPIVRGPGPFALVLIEILGTTQM